MTVGTAIVYHVLLGPTCHHAGEMKVLFIHVSNEVREAGAQPKLLLANAGVGIV